MPKSCCWFFGLHTWRQEPIKLLVSSVLELLLCIYVCNSADESWPDHLILILALGQCAVFCSQELPWKKSNIVLFLMANLGSLESRLRPPCFRLSYHLI